MGFEAKTDAGIGPALQFGPFCLRPAEHLLLEGDTPVPIGVRALDLLVCLVQRAGAVVSRDELVAAVWPGLTVDDRNLRTQIALLRKALRDGQAGARYLMTVPGRGYRFVASVTATGTRVDGAARKAIPTLPMRLTSLVGREAAVEEVADRLRATRFLTILGPGGIGKTALGLAVAEREAHAFQDGIYLVDCAPLQGAALVARKLASALGLDIAEDDPTGGIIAFLRDKRILIILDCCERVADAAAFLVEHLLRAAGGVEILATSREPLRAEGESVLRLPPLPVPPASPGLTAGEALSFPAARLFVERVAASAGRFEPDDGDAALVAEICRRLDGIPLAIELAAGRVDVFGLAGVAARLEDRAHLLANGRRTASARHQTLTATLDWSYDALSAPEQAVLRRLAVFAGSFGLDTAQVAAAHPVAAAEISETVASLVSKSLVNADFTAVAGQYRLLDTTRSYALEKLRDAGELDATYRRHAVQIQTLLDEAAAEVASSALGGAAPQLTAQSRLIDEARAIIDWAFTGAGDLEAGIALTLASIPLWTHLSLNGECRRYVEQALAAAEATFGENDRREMRLLNALGAALIYTGGSGRAADAAWEKALRIAEGLDEPDYQVRILWGLWSSHFNSGQIRLSLETAKRFHAVAARHGDEAATLVGERTVGMSLFYLGDHAAARQRVEAMLGAYVRPADRSHILRFQFDPRVVARTLRSKLLWAQGFPDQAIAEARGAADEAIAVGHAMSLSLTLAQGGCSIALQNGDLESAQEFIDLLKAHTLRHGLDHWHAWARCFDAILQIAHGRDAEGLVAFRKVHEDLPRGAFFLYHGPIHATWAEALGRTGEVTQGLEMIDAALARSARDDERWYLAEFLRVRGELLRRLNISGGAAEAVEQFRQAVTVAREQDAPSWELRAALGLAQLYRDLGRHDEARRVLAPIHDRFTEGFGTADLRVARRLLDELAAA